MLANMPQIHHMDPNGIRILSVLEQDNSQRIFDSSCHGLNLDTANNISGNQWQEEYNILLVCFSLCTIVYVSTAPYKFS